jgi:hypothetical protein
MNMNSNKHNIISGCVLVAIGAWAALAPFVVGTWVWEWNPGRILLAVVPGSAAVLGGLMVLAGRRPLVSVGGTLALAGGLWFIVGPPVYALFVGQEIGTGPLGESVRLFQWVAFFFGAGAFISLVSSYALGFLAPLDFGDEMWAEPATTATPTARARVPMPAERPRRQRGVTEPAARGARPHTRGNKSPQRDG